MQHADPKVLGIVLNAVSLIAPDCIVYVYPNAQDLNIRVRAVLVTWMFLKWMGVWWSISWDF